MKNMVHFITKIGFAKGLLSVTWHKRMNAELAGPTSERKRCQKSVKLDLKLEKPKFCQICGERETIFPIMATLFLKFVTHSALLKLNKTAIFLSL